MELVSWLLMILSKAHITREVRAIGQRSLRAFGLLLLEMGMTVEWFHSCGTVPVARECCSSSWVLLAAQHGVSLHGCICWLGTGIFLDLCSRQAVYHSVDVDNDGVARGECESEMVGKGNVCCTVEENLHQSSLTVCSQSRSRSCPVKTKSANTFEFAVKA